MSCLDVLKAILTRLIFTVHGFIVIWRVTDVKQDPIWWYLAGTLLGLLFESLYTLLERRGQEFKWFCPSVLLYLCTVVPAIWLLELDRLEKRITALQGINFTFTQQEELSAIETFGVEIKIPIQLSSEHWTNALEQLLLFILIIGRWMLPKGELTRDQLSQLLLVYIGTAADIIEFFEAFKEEEVRYNRILCFVILSIWSWSLLQFTLVLTATKGRKSRLGGMPFKYYESPDQLSCCTAATWGIMSNIMLQDGPFLTLRLILILKYKVISYMNIFFTSKNTLVITLQLYRLVVVYLENKKEKKNNHPKIESIVISNNMAPHGSRQSLVIIDPNSSPRRPNPHNNIPQSELYKHSSQKLKKNYRNRTGRPEYWPEFWDQAYLYTNQQKHGINPENSHRRSELQRDNFDGDMTPTDFHCTRTMTESAYLDSSEQLRPKWDPFMDYYQGSSSLPTPTLGKYLGPHAECYGCTSHIPSPMYPFPQSFDPRFAYYGFVAPLSSPMPSVHPNPRNGANTGRDFACDLTSNQNFVSQAEILHDGQILFQATSSGPIPNQQNTKQPTFYDPRGRSHLLDPITIQRGTNQQSQSISLSEMLSELAVATNNNKISLSTPVVNVVATKGDFNKPPFL